MNVVWSEQGFMTGSQKVKRYKGKEGERSPEKSSGGEERKTKEEIMGLYIRPSHSF